MFESIFAANSMTVKYGSRKIATGPIFADHSQIFSSGQRTYLKSYRWYILFPVWIKKLPVKFSSPNQYIRFVCIATNL